MYSISQNDFLVLSKRYNVIPVFKEVNADLDTPVSAFLKIKDGDYAFLLESVEGQEKLARYSILGSNPSFTFTSKGNRIEIYHPGQNKLTKFITKNTPLDEIAIIMRKFKTAPVKGLPRFYGGMVGFIGYDMVRFFEKIPDKTRDDLRFPDSEFILTEDLLIFDHLKHSIKIVANVILNKKLTRRQKIQTYLDACSRIEEAAVRLENGVARTTGEAKRRLLRVSSNMPRSRFLYMVKKAKDYIKRGDIIQVVLSQRFKVKTSRDPFAIYRTLRSLNPSPYMYFLKLKNLTIVGSSPEMLVRCEEGMISTRPIAGTRPRGKNAIEDGLLANELRKDKKEKAEHLMLVDLGRNDLGRVSVAGSVRVNEFMNIEKYSHVMHLVSEVKGRLDKKRFDIYDCLKSAFPAGTVSGSPKIRAMQIIDELEGTRRGPYAGCIGYFGFSQNMDTCITIRTILIKKDVAYVQAGAGIVADSVPEKEYTETVNKAKALIEAIKS
jgi:anthranilate synthase component 1